jgi:hypothetical protein
MMIGSERPDTAIGLCYAVWQLLRSNGHMRSYVVGTHPAAKDAEF